MTNFTQLLFFALYLPFSSCQDAPATLALRDSEPEGSFNWSAITPSATLNWQRCYERHECARLEVPMDPKDSSLNEIVALAVIRDPVNISRSDDSYGGVILINPGGPGESGVNFVRWAGYETHHKIEGPKHFDLVSWDPRGVGSTTPEPFCFDDELDRQLYWLKQDAAGMSDESDHALHFNLQAAKAFGQSCNSTIMQYMTTMTAVEDALSISDALEPDVKEPLINFWGLSYGTFLGNTLASVYPHRIGKMIIDGVVSTDDYISDNVRASLRDTQKILDQFYTTCSTLGPEKCPLYEDSPSLISAKVDTLLKSLPIPVANSAPPQRSATLLTSSTLRNIIFQYLYYPHATFPALAELLYQLTQSLPDTTIVQSLIPTLQDPGTPVEEPVLLPTNDSWTNPLPSTSSKSHQDTLRIIACTDADPIYNWTISDFTSYLSDLNSSCPIAAGPWAALSTTCTGWPESKRAPSYLRFTGPFGSSLSEYSTDRGARPILFIGNEADVVCPLIAAQTESSRHEGSVVLKTNIFGHASVPLNPSQCVWEVEKRYWNFGELPEEGTVCEGDWDITIWELRQDESAGY